MSLFIRRNKYLAGDAATAESRLQTVVTSLQRILNKRQLQLEYKLNDNNKEKQSH